MRGEADEPGDEQGNRAFPKRKFPSIPSNPRGELARSVCPGRKSGTVGSIIVRSMSHLAGSTAVDVMQGMVFYLYFISHAFVATLSEWANKIALM
jgi:hypothetical protein